MARDTDSEAKKSEIAKNARERVREADSLADTEFSKLFHEARTSRKDSPQRSGFSGVSVQVRVRDGSIETSDPVKTRQGEHLRGTDAWDAIVSLPVRPFMETSTAKQEIARQLGDLVRRYAERERREREQERAEDYYGSH